MSKGKNVKKEKNIKKINNKNKNYIMYISIAVVVLLIVIYLILNSTIFSAKSYAKKYAEAVATGDKVKEYKYAGVTNQNEFVSEKEIEETYKNKVLRKVESLEIVSEKEAKKIKDVKLPDTNKNEKLFVAKYKLKNSKSTRYLVVTLKRTNNKYLIFSNWKVTNQDYFSDNVVVKIPNNTKAYLNNKALTDNYKMDSNDTDSVSYEIPNLAKKSVLLQLELQNGIKIEKTINPSSNNVVDATDFSGYKLSSSSNSALEKIVTNFSNLYVSGALNNKDVSSISKDSIWTKELVETDEFKNNYQTLIDKYKTKKVSNYKIKDVELPSTGKNEKLFVAKYKLKNSKSTRYLVITLKRTNNKYLIFSNWKITNQDYFSDNVVVKIPNNTKAYLNNKALTDNYKMDSNDADSVSYEIPNLAKKSVLLQLELQNGIKIEKTINPSSNNVVDATDFSGYKLSSSSSSALEKVVTNFSNLYVSGALKNKDFNSISKDSIWTKELIGTDEFKNNYQTLIDKYKTKKVSNYKIKSIDTASSYIYSFDTIKINANVKYSYKLNKKEKEKSTTFDIEVKNSDKLYINGFSIYGLQYMF